MSRFKTSHQLASLAAIALVGVIVIGVLHGQLVDTRHDTDARWAELTEFADTVAGLETDLLAAQSVEKDLQLQRDLQYLEQFQTRLAGASSKAASLGRLAPDARIRKLVGDVVTVLVPYGESVNDAAEAQIGLGMDEGDGFIGKVRKAEQALQTELDLATDPELLRTMLTMRRHVEDFRQRGDDKYVARIDDEQRLFTARLRDIDAQDQLKAAIRNRLNEYVVATGEVVDAVKARVQAMGLARMHARELAPAIDALRRNADDALTVAQRERESQSTKGDRAFMIALIVTGAILVLTLILLASGIGRSMTRLRDTLNRAASGDLSARTDLSGSGEFSRLGRTVDTVLDRYRDSLSDADRRHQNACDAISQLAASVQNFADKDLSAPATSSDDLTNELTGSLNAFLNETTLLIADVDEFGQRISRSGSKMRSQSETTLEVATAGRNHANRIAEDLHSASEIVSSVASFAQTSDTTTGQAIKHADGALHAVNETIGGINGIRETIRETEKRIKRLGERSHEISGVVTLINTIAERTHILALNASMHAASAGEAGRGFAVVADEVQRLAENAREATSQISGLVNNIQVETSGTANSLKETVLQIDEGSRLAEHAGERIRETQNTTETLSNSVGQIIENSKAAERADEALRTTALEVCVNTDKTLKRLREQTLHANRLAKHVSGLQDIVHAFKLPAMDDSAIRQSVESLPVAGIDEDDDGPARAVVDRGA